MWPASDLWRCSIRHDGLELVTLTSSVMASQLLWYATIVVIVEMVTPVVRSFLLHIKHLNLSLLIGLSLLVLHHMFNCIGMNVRCRWIIRRGYHLILIVMIRRRLVDALRRILTHRLGILLLIIMVDWLIHHGLWSISGGQWDARLLLWILIIFFMRALWVSSVRLHSPLSLGKSFLK